MIALQFLKYKKTQKLSLYENECLKKIDYYHLLESLRLILII